MDKESNWLPASDGYFSLYIRSYGGKQPILDGSWQPSKIAKASWITGALLNPEDRSKSAGRAMVRVDLTDDMTDFHLPPGAVAQVAVYSDHWQPIAVVRRILRPVKSWMNYVI